MAPTSSASSPPTLTHVNCRDLEESWVSSRKAPRIATTSAVSSERRNSASRERFSVSPCVWMGGSASCFGLVPRRASSPASSGVYATGSVCAARISASLPAASISASLPIPPLTVSLAPISPFSSVPADRLGCIRIRAGTQLCLRESASSHSGRRRLQRLSPRARMPIPRPRSGSRMRFTASLRERTPSLPNAEERWLLTVLSARNSCSAIWLFM